MKVSIKKHQISYLVSAFIGRVGVGVNRVVVCKSRPVPSRPVRIVPSPLQKSTVRTRRRERLRHTHLPQHRRKTIEQRGNHKSTEHIQMSLDKSNIRKKERNVYLKSNV